MGTFKTCRYFSSPQVTDEALDSIESAKEEAAGLTDDQVKIIQEQWEVLAKNKKQNGVDLFVA